jgi:poly-gamma-glutamate synthesis protein (capsule biosynthesis protein)
MRNLIRFFSITALILLSTLIGYVAFSYDNVGVVAETFYAPTFIEKRLSEAKPVEILFVGDIMLDRHVELRMKEFGWDYPFASTTDIFKKVDAVVANLEGPIMENRVPAVGGNMNFSFATSTALLLKNNGVTHVSLANNHTNDKGKEVLEFTRQTLESASIKHFGDPISLNDHSVIYEKIEGREFIFIGLNQTFGTLNIASTTSVIKGLRALYDKAIIIPFMHWGEEYKLTNNRQQESLAHELIDAGADVVIGSHPHVVQNIEKYNGKIIFYSLGNFIFDQYFSSDTMSELGVKMTVSDKGISYELLPFYAPRSKPVLMDSKRRELFLSDLAKRSSIDISELIKGGRI